MRDQVNPIAGFGRKFCYEKAAHKGLDYGSVRRLFMVSGCQAGQE